MIPKIDDAEGRQPAHQVQVYPLLRLQRKVGNYAVGRLIQAKLKLGQPDDKYEREADRIADLVMRMPEPGIQLKPT